ncbi:MAG: response regulator, partial [Leptospira sp.]|nr:response regulator [Leptospira sp.]
TIARNGKEALIKLENKVYDAILMDINMPVMNGYETTELIRTSENPKIKNIPILGLTGLTSKEDLDKCKAVGMNSVINKPVEVDYLIFEILRFVFP